MKNTLIPEQAALNLEIEQIENSFFADEQNPELKRGKSFHYLCLSILCNIEYKNIDNEDITDGNDEEGIDIIHLDELNNKIIVNIFNCKSSEKQHYTAIDLTKLHQGLRYIFEEKQSVYQNLENYNFVDKIVKIRNEKSKIIEINVYYCVFGGSSIEPNVNRKVQEIERQYKELVGYEFDNADFNLYLINCKKLLDQKHKNEEPLRGIKIKIPYYSTDVGYRPIIITKGEIKGYLATINAKDIAKQVEKYKDSLFEKNIRGWLRYNKPNTDIYNSCVDDESELFWFMNNGITIIADKVHANNYKFQWEIINMQIINGQQTAWMIYEAYNKKELRENVNILCRIYESKDVNLVKKITKATNTQSSIGSRDLMSNEPEQIAIEKVFSQLGYFYERQKGQIKSDIKFKKDITSKKMAQVSLAILCKKPSLARKNIEDNFFNKDKNYNNIFSHDPKVLLLAYFVFDYCDKQSKQNKIDGDELKYFGTLHIARILWEHKEKLFLKDIILTIQKFENGQIDLLKDYEKSAKKLKNILKQKDIESIGHYLSRIEVDGLIFEALSKE